MNFYSRLVVKAVHVSVHQVKYTPTDRFMFTVQTENNNILL